MNKRDKLKVLVTKENKTHSNSPGNAGDVAATFKTIENQSESNQ